MKRKNLLIAIPLVTACITAQAETCRTLGGMVKLKVDPACNIAAQYSGPTYIGLPGTCFSSTILLMNGKTGSGFSGITKELSIHPLSQGSAQTPAIMNEQGLITRPNEFGLPESRRFFTARSVISLPGGKIYTADAGVMAAPPTTSASLSTTEQMIVVKGDGVYKNSKGTIFLGGNVAQDWSSFTGTICTP